MTTLNDNLAPVVDKLAKLIQSIEKAEKINKRDIPDAVNQILTLAISLDDSQHVNRFLNVLTTSNKRYACVFFKHFLPFQNDKDGKGNIVKFTKMVRKNDRQKYRDRCEQFLDNNGNFWDWVEENTKGPKKLPKYDEVAVRAVSNALKGKKMDDGTYVGAIDPTTLFASISAVFDTVEGMNSTQFMKSFLELKLDEQTRMQELRESVGTTANDTRFAEKPTNH